MEAFLDPDTTYAGALPFIDELCHDLPKVRRVAKLKPTTPLPLSFSSKEKVGSAAT